MFGFVFACFRSSFGSHVDNISISGSLSVGLRSVSCWSSISLFTMRFRCPFDSCVLPSLSIFDIISISVNLGLVNVYLQSFCQLRYKFASNFGRKAVSKSGSKFVVNSGCNFAVTSGSKFVANSGLRRNVALVVVKLSASGPSKAELSGAVRNCAQRRWAKLT